MKIDLTYKTHNVFSKILKFIWQIRKKFFLAIAVFHRFDRIISNLTPFFGSEQFYNSLVQYIFFDILKSSLMQSSYAASFVPGQPPSYFAVTFIDVFCPLPFQTAYTFLYVMDLTCLSYSVIGFEFFRCHVQIVFWPQSFDELFILYIYNNFFLLFKFNLGVALLLRCFGCESRNKHLN